MQENRDGRLALIVERMGNWVKPLILSKNLILREFGYSDKATTIGAILQNKAVDVASRDVLQNRCS